VDIHRGRRAAGTGDAEPLDTSTRAREARVGAPLGDDSGTADARTGSFPCLEKQRRRAVSVNHRRPAAGAPA
jgi:hypothetical protein